MTKVNFSNVSDLKPMPPGDYEASLVEFSDVHPSKEGKPTIRLTFTIQDDQYQGRKVWSNMSLVNEALVFTKRSLVRMGADPEVLNDPDGFEIEEILAGLVGTPVTLSIVINEYPKGSGNFNNQVKEIKSAAGTLFG